MTQASPRINFHGSPLIRCLEDLAVAETADPGDAFAETLGQWIHFADAISLSAVHADQPANAARAELRRPAGTVASVRAEFDRIQALLSDSILKSCSPTGGRTHIKLPEPILELPLDLKTAYPPYRRFYEAHQRDMEMSIEPLRFNVRDAVGKISPALRKLAELDATFEKILRERESKLLSKIPVFLGKRFEQLFNEHRQALTDSGQTDRPVAWMQAGGWLARFCKDMQTVLLAELELRLQPTLGLIEACNETTQQDTSKIGNE